MLKIYQKSLLTSPTFPHKKNPLSTSSQSEIPLNYHNLPFINFNGLHIIINKMLIRFYYRNYFGNIKII